MFFKKKISFEEHDLNSVIAACIAGNGSAERVLIKQHLSFAKMVTNKYASNAMEAEEIVNDGFLKVLTNLDKYDATLPFKAWLRTIMLRTAIDYYRKNLKYNEVVPLDEIEVQNIGSDIINKISADEILKMVQKLSPAYRLVFTMYAIDGYSHKEIGEMLGIKEGTSKSNLQDARKKLQIMIKNLYPNLYLVNNFNVNRINEN